MGKTKHPTTLLHLSGGMDSTYTMYQFLRDNPDEHLLVHHVKLRHNAEDRLVHELRAVKDILAWFTRAGYTN